MDHAHDVTEKLRGPALELRGEIPEVLRAYAGLSRAAMSDGAISVKVKELAALAIAITRECDGCIVAHVRNLVRAGASRREVAELIGVAIVMNGGPATVWGPRALAAFDQVVAERSSASPNR
jgi:AhpD family alkylhydroperoxidase